MPKAELKTKPQKQSVAAFLKTVDNDQRRKDANVVDKMMRDITGEKGVMWGRETLDHCKVFLAYNALRGQGVLLQE